MQYLTQMFLSTWLHFLCSTPVVQPKSQIFWKSKAPIWVVKVAKTAGKSKNIYELKAALMGQNPAKWVKMGANLDMVRKKSYFPSPVCFSYSKQELKKHPLQYNNWYQQHEKSQLQFLLVSHNFDFSSNIDLINWTFGIFISKFWFLSEKIDSLLI